MTAIYDLGLLTCIAIFYFMLGVQMFTAQTEWNVPEKFPDLSKYSYVAIDLETRDPNLKSRGSGAVIGEGEIIQLDIEKVIQIKELYSIILKMFVNHPIQKYFTMPCMTYVG